MFSFLSGREAAPDPRLGIVLTEAIRAIAGQQDNLDNLRSRVGILLSAATIATSFLGGLVLDDGKVGWIGIAAVGLFVLHVLTALWILWPRQWTFHTGTKVMVNEWIEKDQVDEDKMRWRLARRLELYFDANADRLESLWNGYALAIALLGLEIAGWLAELGGFEGWLRTLQLG